MLKVIWHVPKTLPTVVVYNQDLVVFQGGAGRVSRLVGVFSQWNLFFGGDFKFIRVQIGCEGPKALWGVGRLMPETLAYQRCRQSA